MDADSESQEDESTTSGKQSDSRRVQFSLEKNRTYEFNEMESTSVKNGEEEFPNEIFGEDLDEAKKKQRDEIRKLNRQLHQFKQQCKKEMEIVTNNMDTKRSELEQEISVLQQKKDFYCRNPDGGESELAGDSVEEMTGKLKEVEKELARKVKKIHKYEKKIEHLEEQMASMKTQNNTDEQSNSKNVSKAEEYLDKDSQTETDILLEYEMFEIKKNDDLLERKKRLLSEEQKLLDREEELSQRQQSLTDYEKEIEEVEGYLNRRQAIVSRQQEDLLELNKELGLLRQELDAEKLELRNQGIDVESSKEKAKLNWEFLRRSLVDKQSVLERQLRQCKSQLAEKEAKLVTKESTVSVLEEQIKTLQKDVEKREGRIKQLESHLVVALDETKQLQNNDKDQTSNSLQVRRSSTASFGGSSSRAPSEFTYFVPSAATGRSEPSSNLEVDQSMFNGYRSSSPTRSFKNDLRPITESATNGRLNKTFSGLSSKDLTQGINKNRPSSLKSRKELGQRNPHSPARRTISNERNQPSTSVTFDYESPRSTTCSVM